MLNNISKASSNLFLGDNPVLKEMYFSSALELLIIKDAYKEGDPMYWLSKDDPLYIDWNIPEKRGTNVDRSEC